MMISSQLQEELIRQAKCIYEDTQNYDSNSIYNVSIKVKNQSLINQLSYFNTPQKSYIKSKKTGFEVLLLGQLLKLESNQINYDAANQIVSNLLSHSDIKVYTAIAFQNETQDKNRSWKTLPQQCFYIPFIECEKLSKEVKIKLNICKSLIPSFEALKKRVSDIFISYDISETQSLSLEFQKELTPFPVWKKNIHAVINKIKQHELSKLVLARQSIYQQETPIDPSIICQYMSKQEPSCSVYFQQFSAHHAFLSITPEHLFLRQNKDLYMDVIAGTNKKGSTAKESDNQIKKLKKSKKDMHEHKEVFEYINKNMSSVCDKVLISDPHHVIKLSQVHHLKTIMTGQLASTITDIDLVKLFHPTPATGGAPKDKGLSLIQELEPINRGWYAGALGYISKDLTELMVGIRSCVMESNQLMLFGGAGIVEGSNAESEWQEVDLKLKSYKNLFNNEKKISVSS